MKKINIIILLTSYILLAACSSQDTVQEQGEAPNQPMGEEIEADYSEGIQEEQEGIEEDIEEIVEDVVKRYPVKISDRFGFINAAGEIVIEPQFDWAGSFSNGLARVMINERFGFIDESGTIVIEPTFEWVEDFSDGLAMFSMNTSPFSWMEYEMYTMDGGMYGYINTSGEIIIEPRFYDAYPFYNGVAPVKAFEDEFVMNNDNPETIPGKWGLINQQGEWVVKPAYEYIMNFSEGLAAFNIDGRWDEAGYYSVPIGGKWGFLDSQGNQVITPQYDLVQSFSEGVAAVQVDNNDQNPLWGFIDLDGNVMIEPEYEEVYGYHNGLAVVRQGDAEFAGSEGRFGRWGYINLQGEEVIPFQYDWASNFSTNRAFVYHGNVIIETSQPYPSGGRWSVIDSDGIRLSTHSFKHFRPFHEGLALVHDGEKWMYIDEQAQIVWQE